MLVCLDIETTGLSPDKDKIIEIGAALVNLKTRKIEDRYKTFINPGIPIPHTITHLTGITDENTANAPKIHEIKEELLNFVKDYPIMGHNINFDLDFLAASNINVPCARLDSMDIAHIAIPKNDSYSLEIIAAKFNIPETGQHRALKDAEVNIDLMFQLFDLYFSKNESLIPEILEILEKSESPWAKHLIQASKNFRQTKFPEDKRQLPAKSSILNPQTNTLTETSSYSLEDLIPENPNLKTIIATSYIPDESSAEIILNADQYINDELFQKLLKKPSLTREETTFALKLLPLPSAAAKTNITIPMELKETWFQYNCRSYPKEIEEKLGKLQTIILNHGTLAKLSLQKPDFLKETHLIIDQVDELFENTQQALTSIYTEKRFMQSSLPEEIKDKLLMLFGYLGIMAEKYGDSFGLEMTDYHFSVIDWQKIEDLIEKIVNLDIPDSEEKQLLLWLSKAIKDRKNTKVIISLTLDKLPVLKVIPLNIDEILAAKTWPLPEKLSAISSAITYKGEIEPGSYLKKTLALPQDFKVKILQEKTLETETYPLPHPKAANFPEKADQKLRELLPALEGLTYILVGSENAAKQIHHKIALSLKNDQNFRVLAQKASGGMGKIKKMCSGNPDRMAVIGTYDFWKYTKPDIANLIIYKIPFPPPSKTPHKDCENPFKEHVIPSTSLKLKKIGLTAQKVISFDNRLNI
ncbi:MAG: exonuclease domain-containing protein [Patescibacteria group bacterium]|nr:ribonuclease H-like domain-containing protein [Patescibacteria group bacterium]